MVRIKLIAANWKMHKDNEDAVTYGLNFKVMISKIIEKKNIEVLLCPPFTALSPLFDMLRNSEIKLGAQNLHHKPEGAFTGEVSGSMIKSTGADYVIVGHSERRNNFNEDNEIINQKIKSTFQSGLIPILCIGETLDERKQNQTKEKLETQLLGCLDTISKKKVKNIVIAYEPIWAISTSGTGIIATSEQAEEVHELIRKILTKIFDKSIAQEIRILYGGSVKPDNAKDILAQKNIDGVLVGGASLEPRSFAEIVEFAVRL